MEKEANIEDLDIVSKEIDHPMDLIISLLPKKPIRYSEEKYIAQEVAKEDQINEVRFLALISSSGFTIDNRRLRSSLSTHIKSSIEASNNHITHPS